MHRKALFVRWFCLFPGHDRPRGHRQIVYRLKAGEASWQPVVVRVAKD